jgi:hypothetical protein
MAKTVERTTIERMTVIDGVPTSILVTEQGFWVRQGVPADGRCVFFGMASGLDALIDELIDMRERFIQQAPLEREV